MPTFNPLRSAWPKRDQSIAFGRAHQNRVGRRLGDTQRVSASKLNTYYSPDTCPIMIRSAVLVGISTCTVTDNQAGNDTWGAALSAQLSF
jgi:hypothetical protein